MTDSTPSRTPPPALSPSAWSSPGLSSNPDSPCRKTAFARKELVRCFFCGGEACPKCGLNAYEALTTPPAIDGLHSHWINDSIIAMQRPNDIFLVDKRGIDKFIEAKVTAVFNLTEPGEHPYCGTGILEDTGFPYTPERFMEAGIKHFNYSWPDMTVPKIELMMNIVNIASIEISKGGKIAVHCHAGFGRTGIAIACIMMVKDQLESSQVITFIRKRRPGSIQTTAQEKFVKKFERSYNFMMQIFPTNEAIDLLKTDSPRSTMSHYSLYQKSIKETIRDQNQLLTLAEQEFIYLKYLHKLIYFSTIALSSLAMNEYLIACYALTGLTKLVPKNNNWDLDQFEGQLGNKFVPTANSSSGKSFRAKSFMVVTNSLSEVSEEKIMDDIKLELNRNKWTRFMSVGDVVAGALKMSQDSVKQMNRLTERVQSFKKERSFVNNGNSNGTLRRSFDSMNTASIKAAAAAKAAANAAASVTGGSRKTNSSSNLIEFKPLSRNGSGGNLSNGANALSPSPSSTNFSNDRGGSGGGSTKHSNRAGSPGAEGKVVKMTSSRFRQNSLLENSDKDYNKSKKVASNTLAQLLLDWLETRTDPVFNIEIVDQLIDIWVKNYPDIGQIGSTKAIREDINSASDTSLSLYNDINDLLLQSFDKYKLYLLSAIVKLYKNVRIGGKNSSDTNEIPAMDILVGIRLSIALHHATKAYPSLIRHRSLNMEIVKIFILKHTDEERVLINNINFAQEHYDTIIKSINEGLIHRLEIILRTLELLIESDWSYSINDEERVQWDETRIGNIHSHDAVESLESTIPRDLYTIVQTPFSNSTKSIS